MAPFSFKVVARDPSSAARAGILRTPRGPVATPAFVPVATLGAVRAATPECLEQWGATLLMTNAYHLAMRPGAAVVGRLGGLHALSGWPGPLMTDSGGFQAFRLASLRRIDEDGIRFRSHVDGSPHRFTPESVMELHALLGGDLLMPLDLCTGPGAAPEEAAADAERTVRWAARSLAAPRREDQLLYGIVQGSVYPDLREACAGSLVELGFQAYAVGGVSVGESKQEMRQAVRATVPHLPEESTRHLLGVGEIDDLLESIALGIDTFDCVVPTRWARHGAAMTRAGRLNLRNATFAGDRRPIDPECACPTCARFGRGAIRHYLLAGEILGLLLLVTHNVSFVVDLVAQARAAILAGRFEEFLRAQRSRALEKTAALAGAEDEGTAKVAGSPVREAGRDRA